MEAVFATLVLMSVTSGAMIKVTEFFAMEDCVQAARQVRVFRDANEQVDKPVFAICVPSMMGDEKAK